VSEKPEAGGAHLLLSIGYSLFPVSKNGL